jgi:hypothetical protein
MIKRPVPHYINEHQSDMRGIKEGWYGTEENGTLVSGPFSSREDCLKVFDPTSSGGPNAHASVWTQTQSSVDDCDQTPDPKDDGR